MVPYYGAIKLLPFFEAINLWRHKLPLLRQIPPIFTDYTQLTGMWDHLLGRVKINVRYTMRDYLIAFTFIF